MTKLKSKFRIFRRPFSFRIEPKPQHDRPKEHLDMPSSPLQSKRSLGSVLIRRHSSLDKSVVPAPRDSLEDNKENHGTARTDQSCQRSSKMDEHERSVTDKGAMAKPKFRNSNLSPSSATSPAASFRGRKDSDLMKYSSLADATYIRVPSAKTISDRMMQQPKEPSMHSPQTQQIMREVESAYLSSPIPSSYLKSQRRTKHSRSPTNKEVEKAYMSSPLPSNRRSEGLPIARKKAINNEGNLDGGNRMDKPMPLERKASNQSLSGRSSTRSPVTTVASGISALAVNREKKQRKQRMADAETKGTNGRQNLDKRTARLRYGGTLKADILQHRANNSHLNNGSNHLNKTGSQIQDRSLNGVSVCVRKRPIFDYELDRGDYDVVSIDNTTGGSHDTCIIHNCVMHPDMKQMQMKLINYPASAAFDEHCSDDDVYRCIAEPLVKSVVNGGISTILMYGQTGCGKSHTMTGIEARAASGLFQNNIDGTTPVMIQFVELCGSKECKDLLSPSSSDVKIRDSEDGSVQMTSTSMEISSPDELLHAIELAKSRRATESTDKNGVSSRSHAVCQIQMKGSGVLTLIDCAGSERRHDSMYHDSQRQKETAEINTSLWALKECIRARANKSSRIPYRSSTLTRILRQSLEREDANLCVIGCIAPNGTDTEHTMETLKTISTIVGIDDKIVEEKTRLCNNSEVLVKTVKVPKQWTNAELRSFVSRKMGDIKLPSKYDGSAVMKMSVSQMKAQLSIDGNEADQLFNLLRKENDRTSKVQRQERIRAAKTRQGTI